MKMINQKPLAEPEPKMVSATTKKKSKKVIDDDKRSGFPWKLAAIASAALFLITLGIIVTYLLMYKPEIGNSLGIFFYRSGFYSDY
jgi:hypothetical protein